MAANPNAGPKDRQFKVLKFLGKGSYGSVYLVQRLADSKTYALKEMDVRSMSQAEREDSINEIRLLASVQHPSVISYNEAFLDGNRLCIIMEYAADGDLAKVIKKHQMAKRPLPEDIIWRYFIQVVMGLQALHHMKILHRDIKPGNIMVFDNGVVKIGDLGIAKLLTKTAAAKTQIGTPHYMGPEIWKNRPYSYTSDTWAVGCLLYELAALQVPFEARSMSELRYKVLRGTYPPVPGTFSRDLQQMVRECLDPNPDKRPSMDQILSNPAVVSRLKLLPSDTRNPPATAGSALVETIKVPRGNIAAIKNKLPPAQYATDMLLGGGGGLGGGGHHGAQMATIEEGNEDDTPPARAPPVLPPPYKPPPPAAPRPTPMQQYAPSAYAAAQQHARPASQQQPKPSYLPAIAPPVAASEVGGGGYNAPNRRPPPLQAAGQRPSQNGGGVPWWVTPGAAAAPAPSVVSESHAKYGAFYHQNGYSPGGHVGAGARHQQQQQQQQQGSPWGAPWPPKQQYQQQQQQHAAHSPRYESPYLSPYGAQKAYGGGGGDVRLPALQVAKAPQAAGVAGKPPPWNYGGPRKNARGQPMGARGGAYAHGDGPAGADVPRYPPPQWAPRPARW